MSEHNVLTFKLPSKPYVVEADMVLELYLIPANIPLLFGPFDGEEAAKEWLNVFEREHQLIEAIQKHKDKINEDIPLFYDEPYLRTYLQSIRYYASQSGEKDKRGLIEPVRPIDDAGNVAWYALNQIQEAVTEGFNYLERLPKK